MMKTWQLILVNLKNMSNMRSASKDNTVVLKRPRSKCQIEVCLDYIAEDELVE